MDYMRIYKLTEDDFDGIIDAAGGKRLNNDDSRESRLNADYLLDDGVIELKFVEEEGLKKQERQRKLAVLFKKQFPSKPVVVLDPELLGDEGRRDYYKAMLTPIRARLKKAAKQLKQTAQKHKGKTKVVILLNVGYGSLYHEEFKQIAVRYAANKTKQIDCLIVGGIYFYSDKFDSYVLGPFEEVPINLNRRFSSFDKLNKHWRDFLNKFMTSAIVLNRDTQPDRLPVLEMDFELDGVKYVRPAPPIGKPSKFWVNGRPRKNSTGITKCPPVATIFPKLDKENWERFREKECYDTAFRDTYKQWLDYAAEKTTENKDVLKPFINMEVSYDSFCEKYDENEAYFVYLCEYATEVFQKRINEVINAAKDQADSRIILPEYILLVVEEIGQDKANDLSSIYHVRQSLGQQKIDAILENKQLFFEYGLALAASYAVKHGVSSVMYERDQTYMWQ